MKKFLSLVSIVFIITSVIILPKNTSAEVGQISVTLTGANNPAMASELSAVSILVYNGTTPLNGSGEYIPASNFTGSQSYGFTIGNVSLNASNIYKVGVAFFDADGHTVNYNNYTIQSNGATLAKIDTNIFASDVAGLPSGSTIQYSLNINRAATDSISVTVPAMNNSSAASELSAMSVLVYDGTTLLNSPNGEYIPANNFVGSGSYGFTIGNLSLKSSGAYTIGVAIHPSTSSVNLNNYSITVNGTGLTRDSSDNSIFSKNVSGILSGQNLSYSLIVTRTASSSPPPPPPPPPSDSGSGSGSNATVASVGSVNTSGQVPTAVKVSINNNAEITTVNKVTLKLETDSDKSTTKMLVSNDKEFKDASWELFSDTKEWTLPEEYGVKTVYVQFKDYYGNYSPVVTDEIQYQKEGTAVITTETKTVAETASAESTNKTGGEVLGVSDYKFVSSLTLGSQSNEVKQLQLKLMGLGYYKSEVTGYFGTQTLKAVKDFQRGKGITPSGIVGSQTRGALNKSASTAAAQKKVEGLAFGIKNSDVTALQNKLRTAKFLTEKSTGYFGPATQNAVKKFQEKVGLPVTGIADKTTLAKLESFDVKSSESVAVNTNKEKIEQISKELNAKKAELLQSLNLLLIRLQADSQGLR